MSITLFHHNQSAYEAALNLLQDTKRAAVIHPTGTGKSFIACKLCSDHPRAKVCWLSPSEYIFKTQMENWQEAGGEILKNIEFYTYAKLMTLDKSELSLIEPDYIVLDEFHRCGAKVWGEGVGRLLECYPETPMLGLSATNIRYLDNQRDMADELFEGNIASQISLGEAIVRGILNPPRYILSAYSYQKDLEKWEKRVRTAKNKAVRDKAEQYLEALRRALEKADGLDRVFAKHMTDRTGKYIVFCANVEHLYEMKEMAKDWFQKVDKHPHIYTVYADDSGNTREFQEFKADESEHLKLLFCVDMLNEGIHVENVSGVILLRPTVSPIIYKQQIGRALSANKKKEAVIFDIVLNIENLYSIGEVEEEMEIAMNFYHSHGMKEAIVNEHFEIIDEVRDCISLFDRLNDTLSASWDVMYAHAKSYFKTFGNLEVTKRYMTEDGYSLGLWVHTQRRVFAGQAIGTLTEEQIEKLNAIGMRWESLREAEWQKHYEAAKAYFAEHGNLLVSVNDERYQDVKLGRWIGQIRSYRKNHLQSRILTPERIAALDEIGMVWDVPDYLWDRNYEAAVKYRQTYGDLDVPFYYVDEDGVRLGAWLSNMRALKQEKASKRGKLSETQIEKLNQIGMIWESKTSAAWNNAYKAACQYKEENGNLDIPVAYISKDGCRLGRWIRHQRDNYKKGMSAERIEKLNAIGMVWESKNSWNEKFAVVQNFYEEHGHANLPADYVADGVWIGRWLDEQKARMSGKKSGKGQGKGKNVQTLTAEQIEKLKSVGIQENVTRIDVAWQTQYEEAKVFYEKHGNLVMSKDYKGRNGKNLSAWLSRQRDKKDKGLLEKRQCELLDGIGMVWEKKRCSV